MHHFELLNLIRVIIISTSYCLSSTLIYCIRRKKLFYINTFCFWYIIKCWQFCICAIRVHVLYPVYWIQWYNTSKWYDRHSLFLLIFYYINTQNNIFWWKNWFLYSLITRFILNDRKYCIVCDCICSEHWLLYTSLRKEDFVFVVFRT
jgi:hypothetical protein